jgi:hypothetical protein
MDRNPFQELYKKINVAAQVRQHISKSSEAKFEC